MQRRTARLRREYLYRKSLEGKERTEYERKRKIRQALEGRQGRAANSQSSMRVIILTGPSQVAPLQISSTLVYSLVPAVNIPEWLQSRMQRASPFPLS